MRALLDTHAWLWFLFDDPRLSERAAELIGDPASAVLLSKISLWEIVIKVQIGKLRLGMSAQEFFQRHVHESSVQLVDLEVAHLLAYSELPLLHRDPFDRLLVAQAQQLQVPIVSGDESLKAYAVEVLW